MNDQQAMSSAAPANSNPPRRGASFPRQADVRRPRWAVPSSHEAPDRAHTAQPPRSGCRGRAPDAGPRRHFSRRSSGRPGFVWTSGAAGLGVRAPVDGACRVSHATAAPCGTVELAANAACIYAAAPHQAAFQPFVALTLVAYSVGSRAEGRPAVWVPPVLAAATIPVFAAAILHGQDPGNAIPSFV